MSKTADFHADHRWSHEISYAPFWVPIFRKAFPGYTNHTIVSGGKTWAQLGGVDVVVNTAHGQTYRIDQKARREVYFCNECFPREKRNDSEEYCAELVKSANWNCERCGGHSVSDILLEITSNDRTGAPGWTVKPLLCDFIAYVFVPIRRCYLLPVVPLQRAWARRGAAWTEAYGTREAYNRGYKTINVPVPIPILLNEMKRSMVILWDAADLQAEATDTAA